MLLHSSKRIMVQTTSQQEVKIKTSHFWGEHGKRNLQQALRSLDGIAIDEQSMLI